MRLPGFNVDRLLVVVVPGGPTNDAVTDDEIEAMAAVVSEAVSAGALGFSTSRLLLHRDNRGILTPGALAAKKEMLRICDAIALGGGGIYEMSTDFSAYDDMPYHKLDPEERKNFFQSELGWMAESMEKYPELKVSFGIGPGQVSSGGPTFDLTELTDGFRSARLGLDLAFPSLLFSRLLLVFLPQMALKWLPCPSSVRCRSSRSGLAMSRRSPASVSSSSRLARSHST